MILSTDLVSPFVGVTRPRIGYLTGVYNTCIHPMVRGYYGVHNFQDIYPTIKTLPYGYPNGLRIGSSTGRIQPGGGAIIVDNWKTEYLHDYNGRSVAAGNMQLRYRGTTVWRENVPTMSGNDKYAYVLYSIGTEEYKSAWTLYNKVYTLNANDADFLDAINAQFANTTCKVYTAINSNFDSPSAYNVGAWRGIVDDFFKTPYVLKINFTFAQALEASASDVFHGQEISLAITNSSTSCSPSNRNYASVTYSFLPQYPASADLMTGLPGGFRRVAGYNGLNSVGIIGVKFGDDFEIEESSSSLSSVSSISSSSVSSMSSATYDTSSASSPSSESSSSSFIKSINTKGAVDVDLDTGDIYVLRTDRDDNGRGVITRYENSTLEVLEQLVIPDGEYPSSFSIQQNTQNNVLSFSFCTVPSLMSESDTLGFSFNVIEPALTVDMQTRPYSDAADETYSTGTTSSPSNLLHVSAWTSSLFGMKYKKMSPVYGFGNESWLEPEENTMRLPVFSWTIKKTEDSEAMIAATRTGIVRVVLDGEDTTAQAYLGVDTGSLPSSAILGNGVVAISSPKGFYLSDTYTGVIKNAVVDLSAKQILRINPDKTMIGLSDDGSKFFTADENGVVTSSVIMPGVVGASWSEWYNLPTIATQNGVYTVDGSDIQLKYYSPYNRIVKMFDFQDTKYVLTLNDATKQVRLITIAPDLNSSDSATLASMPFDMIQIDTGEICSIFEVSNVEFTYSFASVGEAGGMNGKSVTLQERLVGVKQSVVNTDVFILTASSGKIFMWDSTSTEEPDEVADCADIIYAVTEPFIVKSASEDGEAHDAVRVYVGSGIWKNNMWDSGEIEGARTTMAYGGGDNLIPGEKYWVHISVRTDGRWSSPQVQEFVMPVREDD